MITLSQLNSQYIKEVLKDIEYITVEESELNSNIISKFENPFKQMFNLTSNTELENTKKVDEDYLSEENLAENPTK